MRIKVVILIMYAILFTQCQSGKSFFGLQLETKEYNLGDSLKVKKLETFDSIIVENSQGDFIPNLTLDTGHFKLGFNRISVKAYRNGNKLQRNFTLKILSEIPTIEINPKVIKNYQHNPDNFTQGLEFNDKTLYESSGLYKKSHLSKYKLNNTKPLKSVKINNDYFAEGLTVVGDKIYVLTWQLKKILVFDKNTLTLLTELDLPNGINEGWGITYHEGNFYISNGSEKIYILNEAFEVINKLSVVGSDNIYKNLNELEFYSGKIYANVWMEDFILEIDPSSGRVIRKLNFKEIAKNERNKGGDALNGITFLPNNHLLITGKNWHNFYEIGL